MSSSMLKTAEHAVSRLEAGLDRQKLLLKRPVGVRCDLNSSLPPGLAVSFDDLVGGDGVAGEVLCSGKEERNEKAEAGMQDKSADKTRKEQRTFKQILDLDVAGLQGFLRVNPVRALTLELGLECLLPVLELLQLRLMGVCLVSQLLGQVVTLLLRLEARRLLGAQHGLSFARVAAARWHWRLRRQRRKNNQ